MRTQRIFTLLPAAAVFAAGTLVGCLDTDEADKGPRRIFVTSQAYTGNFGGIAAGDSICNLLAQAAVLGGQWKVFLSDSTVGASERMQEVGPWYRIEANGESIQKVFNNRVGFTVGAQATINNEYGVAVPGTVRAWTGTRADGTADGSQSCSGWTATTGYGTDGNPNSLLATGPKWMYSGEGAAPCNLTKRLYCLEQ